MYLEDYQSKYSWDRKVFEVEGASVIIICVDCVDHDWHEYKL